MFIVSPLFCFLAPVIIDHDALMASVLCPLTLKPSWHSFDTTTGRIGDRKERLAAGEWEGGTEGCACQGDALPVPPIVL